jgi:DNA-directed RNA polymerase subunit alpha
MNKELVRKLELIEKRLRDLLIEVRSVIESETNEGKKEEPDWCELQQQSVGVLELSVKAHSALKVANIKTVADLILKSEPEMLAMKGCGSTTLREIKRELLKKFGLNLKRWPQIV